MVGEMRRVVAWHCSNKANIADVCNRTICSGAHVTALLILLLAPWAVKHIVRAQELQDTRLSRGVQPKSPFVPVRFKYQCIFISNLLVM